MSTQIEVITPEILDHWANAPDGPVALHLKQRLQSVSQVGSEGGEAVVFPPTYANIGYNVDTLADGTRVATIDSVGSQANRMEPLFRAPAGPRERWLVPQIQIVLRHEDCGECDVCRSRGQNPEKRSAKKPDACKNPRAVSRSILDLAHRGADAVVRSTPGLADLGESAFRALALTGDAGPLCSIVPTSLVFGVWDSRGGGEKRPRLVRSIIRAWGVEPLHAAAQFNSIGKALDEEQREELEKEAKAKKVKLSEKGFADAPAVFRKADKHVPQFLDGAPNPEARILGGVLVTGRIEREVTVNLVALRGLRGANDAETAKVRRYLLGLALTAASAEIDLFLREGCQLRYAGVDEWWRVPRRGEPGRVNLAATQNMIADYASARASEFRDEWRKRWPADAELTYQFDVKEAKKLLAKKADDETPTED